MATAVRQRVPFRFSEDDEQDGHILDEQEQEELIGRLRQESETSNSIYYMGLQVVLGLSLLIHLVFLFSSSKLSPLEALLPSSSPSQPVPLATGLTFLNILIHLHLALFTLPPTALPPHLKLPLPLSHPITVTVPAVAPAYALVLGRGQADVIWRAIPGILTVLVALVLKWIRDADRDLTELEKLKYNARGA
ncbi:hypothetical protein C8Q76DRAFT_622003 [Earliella scabrosa]|nr:hypothetical protein C8Q76DRAFT_622003 [Earliella scabrosa]